MSNFVEKSLIKKFSGYEVILDLYEESGEQRSNMFIAKSAPVVKQGFKVYFHASFEYLANTGALHSDSWNEDHQVKQSIIDRIEKWGEENGY